MEQLSQQTNSSFTSSKKSNISKIRNKIAIEKDNGKPYFDSKTTKTIYSSRSIPKEDQIHVGEFSHVLLQVIKEMAARPIVSCERAYPADLRRKALSRDELRRIKEKSNKIENIDEFTQNLKLKLMMPQNSIH